MFKFPEDTTFGVKIKTEQIAAALRKHILEKSSGNPTQLIPIQEGDVHDDCYIYALGSGPFIDPKPFTTPIHLIIDDQYYSIFDSRGSTRYDRATQSVVIQNKPLFRRDLILTLMSDVFRNEPQQVYALGALPIYVFSNWVSQLINRRFALDPSQYLELQLITAYYYLCLFMDDGSKMDKTRIYPLISRALSVSVSYVIQALQNVEFMGDIEEYLTTVRDTLQTERLEGLTSDILATILGGTWFGPNHVQLVATALEHPATFCSLVYLSITDRANRSTGLATIALRKEKDAMGREFVKIASDLLSAEYPDFNS